MHQVRFSNGLECYTPQQDQQPQGGITAALAIFTIALAAAVLLGLLFGQLLVTLP